MAKQKNYTKAQLQSLLDKGDIAELVVYSQSIDANPRQVEIFTEFIESIRVAVNSGIDVDLWFIREDQEPFQEAMLQIHEEFGNFLQDIPMSKNAGTYMDFVTHGGGNTTVEIGWHDSYAGKVLWDRWKGNVGNAPAIAFAMYDAFYDYTNYQFTPPPKPRTEPPLYKYHPERFSWLHQFAPKVSAYYRNINAATGLATLDDMNNLMQPISEEMNRLGMTYPRKLKEDTPSPMTCVGATMNLATAYGRFTQAGRHIIDFPPSLIEMLAVTDIEDIPMKSVNLLFPCQYLHFGPQPNWELAPGWLIDGAYVESRGEPGDMKFTITTIPNNHEDAKLWYIFPEPEYVQDFIETYRDGDFAHAIDGTLADIMKPRIELQDQPIRDITDELKEMSMAEGLDIPENHTFVDVRARTARAEIAQINQQHPVYRAAMRLVVNALLYLTAYPDDVVTVWPDGTPSSLASKANSIDPNTSRKAKSKLTSMGYVPILFCGKQVNQQRATVGIDETSRQVGTHWRRGHWRYQPYGPRNSLRKLKWMLPMLIAPGKTPTDDIPGHLYLVK